MTDHFSIWGTFYPDSKKALTALLDEYLSAATDHCSFQPRIRSIISPHAGYIYSGKVAAHAYRLLAGISSVDTVIVMGPSHHHLFHSAAIWEKPTYPTVLGPVDVDIELADALIQICDHFIFNSAVHIGEHSVDVQIPFIKWILPKARILPIVIGSQDCHVLFALSHAIATVIAHRSVIIIASSDLSHYFTDSQARARDEHTLQSLLSDTTTELIQKRNSKEIDLCGFSPVLVNHHVMEQLGVDKRALLRYTNSSETNQNMNSVVGYGSLIYYV